MAGRLVGSSGAPRQQLTHQCCAGDAATGAAGGAPARPRTAAGPGAGSSRRGQAAAQVPSQHAPVRPCVQGGRRHAGVRHDQGSCATCVNSALATAATLLAVQADTLELPGSVGCECAGCGAGLLPVFGVHTFAALASCKQRAACLRHTACRCLLPLAHARADYCDSLQQRACGTAWTFGGAFEAMAASPGLYVANASCAGRYDLAQERAAGRTLLQAACNAISSCAARSRLLEGCAATPLTSFADIQHIQHVACRARTVWHGLCRWRAVPRRVRRAGRRRPGVYL